MSLKFVFCLSLALCCGLAVARSAPNPEDHMLMYNLKEANYVDRQDVLSTAGSFVDHTAIYNYYAMILQLYLEELRRKLASLPPATPAPAPSPINTGQVAPITLPIPVAPVTPSLLQYLPPGFPQFATGGQQLALPSGFPQQINPQSFHPYPYYPYHTLNHGDSKPSKTTKPSKNYANEESEMCKKMLYLGVVMCWKKQET